MAEQPQLFYEGVTDALRALIQALGGTKKVGVAMRPDKTADDAGRWILDCLNLDRREHLDPDQVLWLLREGRRIGFHAAMDYFASEAGYTASPVDPEDEVASLQREFIAAAKRQEQIVARIERLSTPPLSSVKTGT